MRFFAWINEPSRSYAWSMEWNASPQSNTLELICASLCSLGCGERGMTVLVLGIIVSVSMMEAVK